MEIWFESTLGSQTTILRGFEPLTQLVPTNSPRVWGHATTFSSKIWRLSSATRVNLANSTIEVGGGKSRARPYCIHVFLSLVRTTFVDVPFHVDIELELSGQTQSAL